MRTARHGRRLSREDVASLAASGLRMPIGTDLVLREHDEADTILEDPVRLADVMLEAAARYGTPLAVPPMDLGLEQQDLVARLRPAEQAERFRFGAGRPVCASDLERAAGSAEAPFGPRQAAQQGAIRQVAEQSARVPVGMAIGPFSLLTRLVDDPITAIALAGGGASAADEPLVAAAEAGLELATGAVLRSVRAQLTAGAAMVIVCEPSVSTAFLSPLQLVAQPAHLERFVVEPLQRVERELAAASALLFLHDCGELVPAILDALARRVRPAVLSLGSSRRLWEDARQVPEDVVLFGNLPTKHFHSDATMPLERVRALTRELLVRMREAGRPFILGSECDVLHGDGCAGTIRLKVEAMLAENA